MLQHFIRALIDSERGITADVCHYDETGKMTGTDPIEVTDDLASLFNSLAGIVTEEPADVEPAPEAKSKPAPKRKTKTKEK